MFKQNIGTRGRLLRLSIALFLLVLAYFYQSWILLAFSFFCLFEALKGWCLFYQLMGKKDCSLEKKN